MTEAIALKTNVRAKTRFVRGIVAPWIERVESGPKAERRKENRITCKCCQDAETCRGKVNTPVASTIAVKCPAQNHDDRNRDLTAVINAIACNDLGEFPTQTLQGMQITRLSLGSMCQRV